MVDTIIVVCACMLLIARMLFYTGKLRSNSIIYNTMMAMGCGMLSIYFTLVNRQYILASITAVWFLVSIYKILTSNHIV